MKNCLKLRSFESWEKKAQIQQSSSYFSWIACAVCASLATWFKKEFSRKLLLLPLTSYCTLISFRTFKAALTLKIEFESPLLEVIRGRGVTLQLLLFESGGSISNGFLRGCLCFLVGYNISLTDSPSGLSAWDRSWLIDLFCDLSLGLNPAKRPNPLCLPPSYRIFTVYLLIAVVSR